MSSHTYKVYDIVCLLGQEQILNSACVHMQVYDV